MGCFDARFFEDARGKTLEAIHTALAKRAMSDPLTEEEALALIILLHTHRIVLAEAVLEDWPGITELAALTQRSAAQVAADIWPDRQDKERTNYAWWYWQFNTRTPFEIAEDIAPQWRERVEPWKQRFLRLPLVKSVDVED